MLEFSRRALRKSGRRADVDAAQATVNIDGGDVVGLGLVLKRVRPNRRRSVGLESRKWKTLGKPKQRPVPGKDDDPLERTIGHPRPSKPAPFRGDPAAGTPNPFGGFGVNTLGRGLATGSSPKKGYGARRDPSEQNRVPDRFAALIKRLPPPRGKSIGAVGVRAARIEIELGVQPSRRGHRVRARRLPK